MKIAIMQPYFLPYIGYFQLIEEVDKFVFADNVNYIQRGWINRNRILINQAPNYITVHLSKASSFKRINEISIIDNRPWLIRKIKYVYKKANHFKDIFPMVEDILTYKTKLISELAAYSVETVSKYLNLDTEFILASNEFPETSGLEKTDRIISICHKLNAQTYINAIGGTKLYSKKQLKEDNIDLYFINTSNYEYKQYGEKFTPDLSIIDVLMFNSIEETRALLSNYTLI